MNFSRTKVRRETCIGGFVESTMVSQHLAKIRMITRLLTNIGTSETYSLRAYPQCVFTPRTSAQQLTSVTATEGGACEN